MGALRDLHRHPAVPAGPAFSRPLAVPVPAPHLTSRCFLSTEPHGRCLCLPQACASCVHAREHLLLLLGREIQGGVKVRRKQQAVLGNLRVAVGQRQPCRVAPEPGPGGKRHPSQTAKAQKSGNTDGRLESFPGTQSQRKVRHPPSAANTGISRHKHFLGPTSLTGTRTVTSRQASAHRAGPWRDGEALCLGEQGAGPGHVPRGLTCPSARPGRSPAGIFAWCAHVYMCVCVCPCGCQAGRIPGPVPFGTLVSLGVGLPLVLSLLGVFCDPKSGFPRGHCGGTCPTRALATFHRVRLNRTEAQGGDSDTPSGEGPAPQPHTQPAHEVRLWASPVTPARACAAARTAGVAVPLALELAWAGSPELLWTWFCSWVELLSWL